MILYKRIITFIIAVILCGLGIAITTQANLGTTPISSLPYVLTFVTPFSFGITTIIINILFIIIQLFILKKRFKKEYYLQLVAVILFGVSIDLGMHITEIFKTNIYAYQILM